MRKGLLTSIARKIVMAVTGLFLCMFLVVHLSGNLLLFKNDGGAAFSSYSHFMSSNAFIRVSEIVLLLGFVLHIIDAIVLTIQNRSARTVDYLTNDPDANSCWTSRTMGFSGAVIFIFLVVHLNTFFVKHRIMGTYQTMYGSVIEAFSMPAYTLFYVIAMAILAFHLHHGFQSAFQSLGINHPKYTPVIKWAGLMFSILVPLGFASIPVYFFIKHGGFFR